MIKRALALIAKTFLITFTAVITLGIGFVASMIVLMVIVAGLAAGASNSEKVASLDNYSFHAGTKEADATFVSIPINGVILGEDQTVDDIFSFVTEGVVYGYDVKEELIKLAEEPDVDGIILEVNSPGGTIFGTQAIVDGVKAYKEKTNKPVIAYVGSTAASGGYWAAVSADEIIADHGTVLGSIGVILGPFKYYDGVVSEDGGLLTGGITTENGISTEYITAGKYKDLGNPNRKLSDEERSILQDSVNNSYNSFASYVSERRGIPKETIVNQLGALIYDDIQAKNLKLSDATGNRDEAYKRLATITNQQTFEILQKKPSDSFWSSFSEVTQRFAPQQAATKGCLFDKHSVLLAYYGDLSALCR